MNKILFFFLTWILISTSYAQVASQPEKSSFGSVNWISKNSRDTVTIENGNSVPLVIQIFVATTSPSGINVSNCGTTREVKAGSSVICSSKDGTAPVNFTSNNPDKPANGTYNIKQQ